MIKKKCALLVILSAVLIILLTGCIDRPANMQIKPAALSGEEKSLFEMVKNMAGYSKVYDYRVDYHKIKSVIIQEKKLNKKGKWEELSATGWPVGKESGFSRFFISFDLDNGLCVSHLGGKVGVKGPRGASNDDASYAWTGLENAEGIKAGRTMIIAIYMSGGNGANSDIIEDYYKTKPLMKYKLVRVVTVTFSSEKSKYAN